MKTTTKIIICLAVFTFLLIESTLVYTGSTLEPIVFNYIASRDTKMISRPLKDFNSVIFLEDNIYMYSTENGSFKIIQDDTIKQPVIIYPEVFDWCMKITDKEGKLLVSLIDSENKDIGKFYSLTLCVPITIYTPVMPDSIFNGFRTNLDITGTNNKRISINNSGNLTLTNVNADSLTLAVNPRFQRNENMDVTLFTSKIKVFDIKGFYNPVTMTADSTSMVDIFNLYGTDNYQQCFNPGKLRINRFTFHPGSNNSSFSLTDLYEYSSSFNTGNSINGK